MTQTNGNCSFSTASAPLPSPSAHQGGQQFSFPPPAPPAQRSQKSTSYMHPILHRQTQSPTAIQQPASALSVDASRGGVNDPTASSPFLKDFNLVAEAAKRAQMAVLMRDMGEIVL